MLWDIAALVYFWRLLFAAQHVPRDRRHPTVEEASIPAGRNETYPYSNEWKEMKPSIETQKHTGLFNGDRGCPFARNFILSRSSI